MNREQLKELNKKYGESLLFQKLLREELKNKIKAETNHFLSIRGCHNPSDILFS